MQTVDDLRSRYTSMSQWTFVPLQDDGRDAESAGCWLSQLPARWR